VKKKQSYYIAEHLNMTVPNLGEYSIGIRAAAPGTRPQYLLNIQCTFFLAFSEL